MGFCNCSIFCCSFLYVPSSFAIIVMGKRELVALLSLSSWCLVIAVWLSDAVPWVSLQFVIVVFPEYTHLLFKLTPCKDSSQTVQVPMLILIFSGLTLTVFVVHCCSLNVIGNDDTLNLHFFLPLEPITHRVYFNLWPLHWKSLTILPEALLENPLIRLTDFPIKPHAKKSGWSNVYVEGFHFFSFAAN